MSPPVSIGGLELVGATGLVGIAAVVSLALGLDLERRMLWAALRAVVQLLLIGQILSAVLSAPAGWSTGIVMAVMIAAASHQAVTRPERSVSGGAVGAFITLALVGILTTLTVTRGILHLEPWYTPRYAIPLLGMILGNILTGLSLALDHLLESVDVRRMEVESDLALGATRWEALKGPLARAVRIGMTPILNATSVVGLVALPGMMTGQILAGADPREAVRYQLLVMFMVLGATAIGCLALGVFTVFRVSDSQHRLHARASQAKWRR